MQFLWEWLFWNFQRSQQIWAKTLKRTCKGIRLFCKFTDTQPATLSRNKNPITDIFEVICPYLRNPCLKVDLKGRSQNFETEWILCYSIYLGLYFQPLHFVPWSDEWSIFYKTKKSRLINTICFRVRMIKGYMEITEWKQTVESAVYGTLKQYKNH